MRSLILAVMFLVVTTNVAVAENQMQRAGGLAVELLRNPSNIEAANELNGIIDVLQANFLSMTESQKIEAAEVIELKNYFGI